VEAVRRIALNPGNSLLDDCGGAGMKVYAGTVFNLVRKILNAELCC